MKAMWMLIFTLLISAQAQGSCGNHTLCQTYQSPIILAQNGSLPPESLSNIQAQFGGRVVSIQPIEGGGNTVQLITSDNRVVIVTVDSGGSIISVQE